MTTSPQAAAVRERTAGLFEAYLAKTNAASLPEELRAVLEEAFQQGYCGGFCDGTDKAVNISMDAVAKVTDELAGISSDVSNLLDGEVEIPPLPEFEDETDVSPETKAAEELVHAICKEHPLFPVHWRDLAKFSSEYDLMRRDCLLYGRYGARWIDWLAKVLAATYDLPCMRTRPERDAISEALSRL